MGKFLAIYSFGHLGIVTCRPISNLFYHCYMYNYYIIYCLHAYHCAFHLNDLKSIRLTIKGIC